MRHDVIPGASAQDPADEVYTDERCYILETWNSDADPDVSIARARVEPGVTTALHALDVDERYVITAGRGEVEVDGGPPTLVRAGDAVLIPAGVSQRIRNAGPEDLVFLCVCTPRFRPSGYRDLERIDD